ncbi:siphovirus ReqiPepy6 Gp37-like family protein [Micromonospora arida]|uniref:siphovirus ReqiPepy6 Gp37-like family protein n=1 Tax=Micromonospora arida TaxID=2203715 RepID=UPI003CFA5979
MINLLVTDRNLNVIGDPISRFTEVDVTLQHNEPAAGLVTVPSDGVTTAQMSPGNRLVVIRDKAVFASGPITQPGEQSWSADGEDSGRGTTTIAFVGDLASVAAEVAYPDPAHAITAQAAARREFAVVNAEVAMRALLSENVGPTALTARRIPRLALGALAGVGSPVTMGFRLDYLGDALRSIALAGGGLGFRVRQSGTSLLFEVFAPRNLTGTVRFSRGLGNLLSYAYRPEAPTATVAIVGDGSGEGTSRVWAESVAPAAATWGRMVAVVDRRDTDSATEIAQAGAEALTEGAESAQLETVTVDTDTCRYGIDYDLGDRVSVALNDGVAVSDIVRAVNLNASPDGGEVVTATVGTQTATTDQAIVRKLREYARRLGRLEAI